jgi:hypothetical protein
MTRATFWLLAPVIVATAIVLIFHRGEIGRADYFFFQVMGVSVALWMLIGIGRAILARQRINSP